MFPSYLVRLRNGLDARAEKADLIEILSSGLPIKVLVQNDDILEDLSLASGRLTLGVRGSQIASMALGLDGAFVFQASGADLSRLSSNLLDGLTYHGPALFSVFSGVPAKGSAASKRNVPDFADYLRAASATEARAFPVFVLDPSKGEDWESRFSLPDNPQPDKDWPVHRFVYEDAPLQRSSEDVAFTFVDFVATDERSAARFAAVPHARWQDIMVPVHEFMDFDDAEAAERIPYILMVDNDNALYRVIVEVGLIQAARRCREMWRRIRELGGINNSHARKALAKQRIVWDREKEQELAVLTNQAETAAPQVADENAGAEPARTANEEGENTEAAVFAPPRSDEPWIETARCTTCDECTEINDRMFRYDDNKQAYVADPGAGTYKQLVEAAESCQVAIIHPGKPFDPDAPNLAELIARAELFNYPQLFMRRRDLAGGRGSSF